MVQLINFAIGKPKKLLYDHGKEMESAICKENVDAAFLTRDGFLGDGVGDKKHHGGLDRAVCVYPFEHYARWEEEFQTKLPAAAFGENITVTGMMEQEVCIGDIYQLGDAVIQITQGRIPCSTITKRTNIQGLLKRFVDTGYTGYLCRVLEEGRVHKDAKLELIERHPDRVTVLFANTVVFHQPTNKEGMEKIVAVQELAGEWREKLERRLQN